MKPIDVIEQLVGPYKSFDVIDAFTYQFYECSKYDNKTVAISLEHGQLEVIDTVEMLVEKVYAIKVTLEEIYLT